MRCTALVVILVSFTGCAGFQYQNFYIADTHRNFTCEPVTQDASFARFNGYSPDELSSFEKNTGYSQCKQNADGKEILIVECKAPILYKRILTDKPALCHKFMQDNGIRKRL